MRSTRTASHLLYGSGSHVDGCELRFVGAEIKMPLRSMLHRERAYRSVLADIVSDITSFFCFFQIFQFLVFSLFLTPKYFLGLLFSNLKFYLPMAFTVRVVHPIALRILTPTSTTRAIKPVSRFPRGSIRSLSRTSLCMP